MTALIHSHIILPFAEFWFQEVKKNVSRRAVVAYRSKINLSCYFFYCIVFFCNDLYGSTHTAEQLQGRSRHDLPRQLPQSKAVPKSWRKTKCWRLDDIPFKKNPFLASFFMMAHHWHFYLSFTSNVPSESPPNFTSSHLRFKQNPPTKPQARI